MRTICFHYQDNTKDWDKYLAVAAGKWEAIKLFQYEMSLRAKAVSPGIVTIGRHRSENTARWLDMAVSGQAAQAAREFIMESDPDSILRNKIDEFESLNEEYPPGKTAEELAKFRKIVAFDRAFIAELAKLCPGVKPVVMCAAIGNPDAVRYPDLVQLARETVAAKGAFGYHAYWSVCNNNSFLMSPPHQRDLHMRWAEIDKYLVSLGIKDMKWRLGEVAAILSDVSGYYLDACTGWRDKRVYNADPYRYIDELQAFSALVAATPAGRQGRVSCHIFTSKISPAEWKLFDVVGTIEEWVALRRAAEPPFTPEPIPSPTVVIVPPPAPEPVSAPDDRAKGTDWSRHQGDIDHEKVKASGRVFGCARATVGDYYLDEKLRPNIAGMLDAGMFTGAYHVVKPSKSIDAQMDWFFRGVDGLYLDMPIVLDVELTDGLPASEITRVVHGCYGRIVAEGLKVLAYTNPWFWNTYITEPLPCDLWIANYTIASLPALPRHWNTWAFWQHSSSGTIPGVSGNVDLDVFNGTVEDLEDYLFNGKPLAVNDDPRVQYARTMWYVPDHVTDQVRETVYKTAALQRISATSSADDAAIGDLVDKTVVVWNVPVMDHPLYLHWFGQHYPATKIRFAEAK